MFDAPLGDLQAAVYATFGLQARWRGVDQPVTVLRSAMTAVDDFGRSKAVLNTVVLRVRRSEVLDPAAGDVVEVGPVLYEVLSKPTVEDPRGTEFTCEARRLA